MKNMDLYEEEWTPVCMIIKAEESLKKKTEFRNAPLIKRGFGSFSELVSMPRFPQKKISANINKKVDLLRNISKNTA